MTCRFLSIFISLFLLVGATAQAEDIAFQASPDQVLVLYNADWEHDGEGSAPGQDSREVAEYYVKMHTDPATGKKPYMLGLSCRHGKEHLNDWKIEEVSRDNKSGLLFVGKGDPPEDMEWPRDSRNVEITIPEEETDWDTLQIRLRSELTGEEKIIVRDGESTDLIRVLVSGPPRSHLWKRDYPLADMKRGRCFRFDASQVFSGAVTVSLKVTTVTGETLRDFEARYFDRKDFVFTPVGEDGVSDDKILNEDVFGKVRNFLEDPKNALPDGTLLKEHILYVVVAYGLPKSAAGVHGLEHGSSPKKGDHGVLASLEQRLQTLYYDWERFKPPIASIFMAGGPDAQNGVGNFIVTTGFRYPLTGQKANPYMHPDTYAYLSKSAPPPEFYPVGPLPERRAYIPDAYFAYGVTRIDGADAEGAKRLVDLAVYATRYLRPEMDCRVRNRLHSEGKSEIADLAQRLEESRKIYWGKDELELLGFAPGQEVKDDGLPFMANSLDPRTGECREDPLEWESAGFFPGGMGRYVKSGNGWNRANARIWKYLEQGVTVSACGGPVFGGGPHITNATFWDNRILQKYLLRGKDLGEAFLLSTIYINWSTSLVGDPLLHPDLRKTVLDEEAPVVTRGGPDFSLQDNGSEYILTVSAEIESFPSSPEVALLHVACSGGKPEGVDASSRGFARRMQVRIKGLAPEMNYECRARLTDPYGNQTQFFSRTVTAEKIGMGKKFLRGLTEVVKDVRLVE